MPWHSTDIASVLNMVSGTMALIGLGFIAAITVVDFSPIWRERLRKLWMRD